MGGAGEGSDSQWKGLQEQKKALFWGAVRSPAWREQLEMCNFINAALSQELELHPNKISPAILLSSLAHQLNCGDLWRE